MGVFAVAEEIGASTVPAEPAVTAEASDSSTFPASVIVAFADRNARFANACTSESEIRTISGTESGNGAKCAAPESKSCANRASCSRSSDIYFREIASIATSRSAVFSAASSIVGAKYAELSAATVRRAAVAGY